MAIGGISGAGSYYSGYQNFSIGGSSNAAGQNTSINGDSKDQSKPVLNPGESEEVKPGRKSSPAECETCKNRKYQDGSDEATVSFKAAAHVSPQAAGAAVRAHEGMHVSNAYKKAAENGGKVLQASVQIHTSVCPECGRVYVSGGTTTTQIKYTNDAQPYQANAKSSDAANGAIGGNFDSAA